MANPPCPCTSGKRIHLCCGPYLKGLIEPPDALALMRSRFSAFATGHVAHLLRTLHANHPDWREGEEALRRALALAASTHRYRALTILDTRLRAETAVSHVLFKARVFRSGRDVSFVEASSFRHDGEGWRYLDGVVAEPGSPAERLEDFGL